MDKIIPTYTEYLTEGGLADHAKRELQIAGLFDKDSDYGGMLGKAVMDLVNTFSKQGHSGFSAPWVLQLFGKVANWDTLTPITSNPEEWNDVAEMCGEKPGKLWQNTRCPRFFSDDGGKTWWDVDKKKVKAIQEASGYMSGKDNYAGYGGKGKYYGYWRTPGGNMIQVPGDKSHDDVAYEQDAFSDADNPADAGEMAIDAGWVRITGVYNKQEEPVEIGFVFDDMHNGFAAMKDLMPMLARTGNVYVDDGQEEIKYFNEVNINNESRNKLREFIEHGLAKYTTTHLSEEPMKESYVDTFDEAVPAFEHYLYNESAIEEDKHITSFNAGKENQRWFNITQEKWQYFYDMVYKQLAEDNQYAKDVLETIKRNRLRCSQRQYDYLKSVVAGDAKPSSYGPKN